MQDLLKQTVIERKTDIVLLNQQYSIQTIDANLIADKSKRSAIWTCGTQYYDHKEPQKHDCIVYAKIGGIHIYSDKIEEFEKMHDISMHAQ